MDGCNHCGGDNSQYCGHCEEEYFRLNPRPDYRIELIRDKIDSLAADPELSDILRDITDLIDEVL